MVGRLQSAYPGMKEGELERQRTKVCLVVHSENNTLGSIVINPSSRAQRPQVSADPNGSAATNISVGT